VKRIPPRWWLRLRSGWSAGLALILPFFVIFFGVTARIASYQIAIPVWVNIVVPTLIVLMGLLAAFIRGSAKLLPDSFVDEVGSDAPYRCVLATCDSLREAIELTRPYYGHEFVEHELAEQWRLANPRIFECIYNVNGDLCASFGILALRGSFMDLFIEGRIEDRQLRGQDFLTGKSARECKRLYISGVVVRDPGKMVGYKRTMVMSWAMLQHLKREYGLRRHHELYAIAVTKEAARLMRNLKFELVADGKNRIDKRDLYRYDITRETWQRLLCEIGDCSGMCEIKIESTIVGAVG